MAEKKKKMTKSQMQLVILGVLVATIIGVLIFFVSSGPSLNQVSYEVKKIDTDLSGDVFDHPEYSKLNSPVSLPVTSGPTGRDNPFEPYF